MLEIKNIQTFYGKIQALRDVSIKVNSGEKCNACSNIKPPKTTRTKDDSWS